MAIKYLLPPYSQKGTDASFWAKYGGLKLNLYSNFLSTNAGLLPELRLARNNTVVIEMSEENRKNHGPDMAMKVYAPGELNCY